MMPNASSSSCVPPKTSRLAPATISPDASSTVAVVSALPGRNVISGAIIVRMPGSAMPCLTRKNVSAATIVVATTGISTLSTWWPRVSRMSTPTTAPSPAASTTSSVVGCRIRQRPTVIITRASTVTA
jgi:hypothetical protein